MAAGSWTGTRKASGSIKASVRRRIRQVSPPTTERYRHDMASRCAAEGFLIFGLRETPVAGDEGRGEPARSLAGRLVNMGRHEAAL